MADSLPIMKTRIIRSQAAGPEPCNTLVFLSCLAAAPGPVSPPDDERVHSTVRFQTEFRIDGYLQSQYEWYKANTLVSATASLWFLSSNTDLSFMMAVDSVEPELQQLDGSLAFNVSYATWRQDDALISTAILAHGAALTAYVLCFEPRAERPPSGVQRTPWAR